MSKKNRNDPPAEIDYTLITKALAVVSGKWRLYIILLVGEHTLRYGELYEKMAISEKMLASELKALVALGVMIRTVYAEVPPRVEYTLTTKGRLALPILRGIQEIGRMFN
ncbi:winged helix-turn-helix transcriptional regulator [Larkinella humicola]|uniref:Helix-turn-helix transcriptional regulator n=1 Tax=Larkinella humicola TaxID=2607654 RepID=A0A5N1JK66_9BACT|nr:helix-turn-helix domain-containing protein [Larkinella humicola]KAA9356850.1 helix-turn-helix transcriptional regulator [Larkinella humicola]